MYATARALQAFRPTLRMMRPVPKEEQAAHTVTQRLRRLRKIPAELLPLGKVLLSELLVYPTALSGQLTFIGIVVGFALFAAGYSSVRHFAVDGTIRMKRQNRAAEHVGEAEHASETEHH
ncbi:hypothetical protein SCUCBS95973_003569 [Sporothrix curviconia]|uniref:Uncharacterized protein n=1 Tax=Sporothrix curviconia TaxID=1260050 RepID=A0ABP0BGD8_9PEZI